MKRIIKIMATCLLLLMTVTFVISCDGENYISDDEGNGVGGADFVPTYSDTTRKIVYTVDLDLEFKNVDDFKKQIEAKCKEFGGFVSRSSGSYDDGQCYSLNATYRIPTDSLDEFVEFCEKDARVTNKSVTTRDITSSQISANAERDYLNQKKAIIEGMLEEEGITAKEKLEILDSLAQVNKEIATLEENIKANTGGYEYSTVYVYVVQPTSFVDVFMPILIMFIIPACAFCGIFFGIRGIKKRNRRLAEKAQAQQ